MSLTADTARTTFGGNAATRLLLLASAIPFAGSLLSYDTTGYVHALVAGEPFAGIAQDRIIANDWGAIPANGDIAIQSLTGRFRLIVTITGAARADVVSGRKVYASDDSTFTFVANANTYIGDIVGILPNGDAVVECTTNDVIDDIPGSAGVITYADAAATVSVRDVNKIIKAPITAARTYTLPAVAQCIGKTYTFETGGAFALTIAGNGAEKVGLAASAATNATAGSTITVIGTGVAGSEWTVLAKV
jgi:hypothetical protein